MRLLILISSLLLLTAVGYGQYDVVNDHIYHERYDSVQLKVTYSKHIGNETHYIFRLPSGEKVKSVCYCKEQRKKGDVITVAKKDIEFIKPTF